VDEGEADFEKNDIEQEEMTP